MAVSILKAYLKIPVVPRQELILDLQRDGQGAAVRVTGVIGEEIFHVDDAAHGIRADALLDVAVVHLKGDGFAEIGVSVYLINHGIVGVDVFPESFFCLAVQVNHFLDVHDVIFDEIHHETAGLIVGVVVDRHVGVVLVPAPVLLPGEGVAEQAAVGNGGKMGM